MRFIGILLIMGHHRYLFGYEGDYLFRNCWAWVDFYFMVTGYFTMKHFDEKDLVSDAGKVALNYTFRKLFRFFPYVAIAVFVQYSFTAVPLLFSDGKKAFLISYVDMPYEIMLMTSTGIVSERLAPIWYLSALLIVLPLIIFMLVKHREAWHVISFIFPIMYFGYMGVNTVRSWPNDFVRALACIALGSFAYEVGMIIQEKEHALLFTVIELVTVLAAVYITVWNRPWLNLVELLFFIIVLIMGSGISYSSHFQNIGLGEIMGWLGKMSMPMFLFHWCVGTAVAKLNTGMHTRTAIYYLGTIIIAFVCVIIQNWTEKRKSLKEENDYV